jgi:KaiC/GvpD/RAD55 family RecA-like ATPase
MSEDGGKTERGCQSETVGTPSMCPSPDQVPRPSSPDGGDGVRYDAIPASQLARERCEAIDWLVEGLVPRGSVALIAALQGRGKSWLALDLAYAAAAGGRWMGQFPVKRSRVLIVDEENQVPLFQRRLHLAAKGRQCAVPDDVFVLAGKGVNFDDAASFEALRQEIIQKRPQLVIVDSLIRVHRRDENEAIAMASVFHRVNELVQECGVTFLLVDHQRKTPGRSSDWALTVRGSTEKLASVDVAFVITQPNHAHHFVVNHVKSRWSQPVEPFTFAIEDTDDHGVAVRYVGEEGVAKEDKRLARAKKVILDILRDGRKKRQDLKREAKLQGVSEKMMDETLEALMPDGEGKVDRERWHEGRAHGWDYWLCEPAEVGASDREHAEERESDDPIRETTHGEPRFEYQPCEGAGDEPSDGQDFRGRKSDDASEEFRVEDIVARVAEEEGIERTDQVTGILLWLFDEWELEDDICQVSAPWRSETLILKALNDCGVSELEALGAVRLLLDEEQIGEREGPEGREYRLLHGGEDGSLDGRDGGGEPGDPSGESSEDDFD